MRRKDKEITNNEEIESIIQKATVLRLALSNDNIPYIVPMSFGYENNVFYLHSAIKGKKIDLLKSNPNVAFELDTDTEIVTSEKACDWGMRFKSIVGHGKANFVEGEKEKDKALSIIVAQYTDKKFTFSKESLKVTSVFKIDITEMSGKKSGF